MTDKLQLYDWEVVLGYACVTFLSYKTGKHKVFEIEQPRRPVGVRVSRGGFIVYQCEECNLRWNEKWSVF